MYQDELIGLLKSQGDLGELSQELFDKGRDLFFDGDYKESASSLRQALLLAEQIGDIQLISLCKQILDGVNLFIKH